MFNIHKALICFLALNVGNVWAEQIESVSIGINQVEETYSQYQGMDIVISELIMGDKMPGRIHISIEDSTKKMISATPLTSLAFLSNNLRESSGIKIAVAATLQENKGMAEQKKFKAMERNTLNKYQGEVLLSLVTNRSENWPFNILEIVHFPSLEHYFDLMKDPAYSPEYELGQLAFSTYTPDIQVALVEVK